MEDNQCFVDIKNGSYAAFNELFNKYYKPLCSFVNKYVHDTDAAEDVVQELFTKLWVNRESIEITTNVRAYLFSATKNATLNHIRQENTRKRLIDELPSPDLESFESSLEGEEFDQALEKCINELPDRCREAFNLSRKEGLKQSEIAERMQTSIKTVKNQIWKSLQYLKSCLDIKNR